MNFSKTKVLLLVLVAVALLYSPVYSAEIDTSKYYYIQSAQEYGRSSKGVWDVPGHPKRFKKGQNIKVWDLPQNDRRSSDRAFKFYKISAGVYEIYSRMSSRSRVDVAGGNTKNGTNIHLWDRNNNRYSQRYRVSYRGNGRWKFYTMRGKVICLSARESKNGSNVITWNNHNGPWTEWVLIPRNTYRAYMPVKKVVRRPSTILRVSLGQALNYNQSYNTTKYFSQVSFRKFNSENRGRFLTNRINRLNGSKKVMMVNRIIKAVGKNPAWSCRFGVYSSLKSANLRVGNNFILNAGKKMVRDSIDSNLRRETNGGAKVHLRAIRSMFR
jgi:hypothetical protein